MEMEFIQRSWKSELKAMVYNKTNNMEKIEFCRCGKAFLVFLANNSYRKIRFSNTGYFREYLNFTLIYKD